MKVSVDNGNAVVTYLGEVTEITIPSKKNIFLILFLIAWLGGWFIGEISVSALLFNGVMQPFLLFWLVGWTIGGGYAIFVLGWMLFGREVIYIDRDWLVIEKNILGFKVKKEFEIHSVCNMRVVDHETSFFSRRNALEIYGMSGGKIQFDYGMKTISFGINIDSAEARNLLDSQFSLYRSIEIN